jgi:hypothetical protein
MVVASLHRCWRSVSLVLRKVLLWQKTSAVTRGYDHFRVGVYWRVLWAVVYTLLNSVQISY